MKAKAGIVVVRAITTPTPVPEMKGHKDREDIIIHITPINLIPACNYTQPIN